MLKQIQKRLLEMASKQQMMLPSGHQSYQIVCFKFCQISLESAALFDFPIFKSIEL